MKHALYLLSALFLFQATACFGEQPDPTGKEAPAIKAVNQEAQMVDFSELYKKGKVLVYFYPKANTPGCTAQSCSLRDAYAELTAKGVIVLGVSTDSPEDQKTFQKDHNLPFDLIADEDEKVTKAFGVPTKMGFAKRQAFLIIDGKIAWFDGSASTKEQAADVLAQLEKLQ